SLNEIQQKINEKKKELDKLIKERKNGIEELQKQKDSIEKKVDKLLIEKFNRIYKNKNYRR
ncbi:MAG: hypothetical protein AABY27_03970, partial [Pseudomonadota bacterium]